MTTFLTSDIQAGLDAARRRARARRSRLRVEIGGQSFRVLRLWQGGFSVEAEAADHAAHLRGLADLYDGGRHLGQCLIVAGDAAAGERRFEFKRAPVAAVAPAADFAPDRAAPPALPPG